MNRKIDVIDSDSYAQEVTERITQALNQRDKSQPFHFFLSGGSTPKVVYAGLAETVDSWENVHLWWGDERFVPHDHADSNFRMVREQLLSRAEIPSPQVHPWPILSTPELSAETYDREFRDFFVEQGHSLSLQLLGMGDDGHTASLFPGTNALQETEKFCVRNVVEGKESVRLSLTYPALEMSERVVFLVKGAGKSDAVVRVLERGEDPAGRVKARGPVEFWLDSEAAAKLSK